MRARTVHVCSGTGVHSTAELTCNLNKRLKDIEGWNLQNEHLYRKEGEKVKIKADLGCHGMCLMVCLNASQLHLYQGSYTYQCLQPAEVDELFQ